MVNDLTELLNLNQDGGDNPEIQAALDAVGHELDYDAYKWLLANSPDLLGRFEQALRRGTSQQRLIEFIKRRTRRPKYTAICESAIRYIARKLEEGTW